MTTISRIAELAKIPEIRKKKREAMQTGSKRRKDPDERPPFPLKGKPCFKKPRTQTSRAPSAGRKASAPPSIEEGVGKKVDLKI